MTYLAADKMRYELDLESAINGVTEEDFID